MARIPTVTSQGDARSGRISGSLGGQRASAAAFGGQQAQALGAAAGALDDAAAGVFQYQERKRQEDVANRVAQADFTPQELQTKVGEHLGTSDWVLVDQDCVSCSPASQRPSARCWASCIV